MNRTGLKGCCAIAAALLLAACSQDEALTGDTLPEGQYPLEIASVTMSATHSSQPWTRMTESGDGNSSAWELSDIIGVCIESGKPGRYSFNTSGVVVAITPCYWASKDQNQDVTAWYPTYEGESGTVELAGQSGALAYVLKGSGTGNYNNPVELKFSHALAKVRVVLEGDQAEKVESVMLNTYAQCTHKQGSIAQINTTVTDNDWVTMKPCNYTTGVGKCWEANVVPTESVVDNGYKILKFRVKIKDTGSVIEGTLNDGGIAPSAAKVHEIKIKVSQKQIEAKPNDDGSYTINEGDNVYISGTINGPITIKGTASVELKDVSCSIDNKAPVTVENGTPTIIVTGTNTLKNTAGSRQGGILLKNNTNIVIEGTGTLNIETSARESVGIGAQTDQYCGNITIKGITLIVKGNEAAGIGNSQTGACGNIEIINATVNATGAPAIGSSTNGYTGSTSKCGDIYIENSSVTATGGYYFAYASAIGSGGQPHGGYSVCGTITIKNTNMTESEILSTLTAGGGSAQKIGKGESTNVNGSVTCGTVTIISKDGTNEYPGGVN